MTRPSKLDYFGMRIDDVYRNHPLREYLFSYLKGYIRVNKSNNNLNKYKNRRNLNLSISSSTFKKF